jgi:hypothetical protein
VPSAKSSLSSGSLEQKQTVTVVPKPCVTSPISHPITSLSCLLSLSSLNPTSHAGLLAAPLSRPSTPGPLHLLWTVLRFLEGSVQLLPGAQSCIVQGSAYMSLLSEVFPVCLI